MILNTLTRRFYARSPAVVAQGLIGKVLVRNLDTGNKLEGVIVETEAYEGFADPASHAFRGKTKRNEVMFGEAGHAYVYFTYGFHHCLNFVTQTKGNPSAVLIRAAEPTLGLDFMRQRRKTEIVTKIANGPGKLCQAFSIDLSLNGTDVTKLDSPISVRGGQREKYGVLSGRRIGIRQGVEKPWRFYSAGSIFVSR